jgi:hypothetical protein
MLPRGVEVSQLEGLLIEDPHASLSIGDEIPDVPEDIGALSLDGTDSYIQFE